MLTTRSAESRTTRTLGAVATADAARAQWWTHGIGDPVFVLRDWGRVHEWNQGAARFYGWAANDIIGEDVWSLTRTSFVEASARQVKVALIGRGRWDGEVTQWLRNGSRVVVPLSLRVTRGAADLPSGIVGVVRQPGSGNCGIARLHSDIEVHESPGIPGRFVLYFQPEVELSTGRVLAVEALLRWYHPGLGVLSPGPLLHAPASAERLREVGNWTVHAVARQARQWRRRGHPVTITLNFSAQQLQDPSLMAGLLGGTHGALLGMGEVVLDLPSAMWRAAPQALAGLTARLDNAGIGMVLDDVSTAHDAAALDYLPLRGIKVDVRSLDEARSGSDAPVVLDALHRARREGLSVTAERIETMNDLAQATDFGCDRGFGFLLGLPSPATHLPHLLP